MIDRLGHVAVGDVDLAVGDVDLGVGGIDLGAGGVDPLDRLLDDLDAPADLAAGGGYEPVYETLPGWAEPTRGARRYDELPLEARNYVKRLEEVSGLPAAIVSTGSDRDETIIRKGTIAEGWLAASVR